MREALKGSGLSLVENAGGTYSLRKVPEDTLSLQAMTVSGAEEDPLGPTSGYVAKRSMTGTKTDTPILETPRSISVATRQQMTDRAVHNLDDAVRYMPGVVASSFGSDTRSDWLKVRGFKPTQFLDGLPMAVGVYNNPKLETWNLERVALLRGPASSVYGQTPPGGMLDMVSLRPQNVASHEVKAEVGNYNHKQVSFDSTGPLDDEGRFLYRVSGVVRDSNTQVDHIDDKRYNIAPSLTWNIDDDTRLTFLGQFNRDDTGITSQFLRCAEPSTTRRSARFPITRTSAIRTGNTTTAPTTGWATPSSGGSTMSGSSARTCVTCATTCRSRGLQRAQLMPTAHWNAAPPRWMKTSVSS